VSIAAEIIALQWDGSGSRLSAVGGAIHRSPDMNAETLAKGPSCMSGNVQPVSRLTSKL
jgi:hypothetical protein